MSERGKKPKNPSTFQLEEKENKKKRNTQKRERGGKKEEIKATTESDPADTAVENGDGSDSKGSEDI